MSQTAYYARMIKQQLENLDGGLKTGDGAGMDLSYILLRLWPELECSIQHELPEKQQTTRNASPPHLPLRIDP